MTALTEPVRIGLLGVGTVGSALLRLMDPYPHLQVQAALVRDPHRARDLGSRAVRLTTDPDEVLDGADIVVELLGGVDGPTALMARVAESGARLVTANKAALAERWATWAPWLRAGRVGFEAAVMAGTPVIGPLAGALRGAPMLSLQALLNGSCAYLIARMEAGAEFDQAMDEAAALGYLEADPSLDVDGIDAAHKLTLLARLTVDPDLSWDAVRPRVSGVRGLSGAYVRAERAAGRRLRLVASIEADGQGGWEVGVEARSLPGDHPLSLLGDGRNALVYRGQASGEVWIAGPGAGGDATASAVLADVLAAAAGLPGPRPAPAAQASVVPMAATPTIGAGEG